MTVSSTNSEVLLKNSCSNRKISITLVDLSRNCGMARMEVMMRGV